MASAVIAAASIVAKVTRDQVVELDKEYPGYGFADTKGYSTPAHAKAIIDLDCLSPVHRRSVHSTAYAALGSQAA